jgi:hypothetical protein
MQWNFGRSHSDAYSQPETREKIRAALEASGIEFIPENGGGAGVRLKKKT